MTGRIPPRTLWVGYGRVGARAGEELRARCGEVIALRRSTEHAHDGIRGVRADLSEAPAEALPESQAMVITLPPPQQGYRGVLENLAAALPRVPERTVFVSSTRVFDGDAEAADPAPLLTEQDPPSPRSERARALREGERIAEDLFGALVVRPAGIYGPGRDRLLRTVREGRPVQHRRRTNRIHEVDLARALVAMLEHPQPPPLLHAVDGAPARLGEVVTFLAARLGVDPPPAAAEDPGHGTRLSGALLRTVLSDLAHPDFRSGYAQMLQQKH